MENQIELLEEAKKYYETANEEFKSGHYHQVVGNLMYALYIMEKVNEEHELVGQILYLLCRSHLQLKHFEKAHDVWEKGYSFYLGQDVYRECDFSNIKGLIYSGEGKLAKAISHYEQTIKRLKGDTTSDGARLQVIAMYNAANGYLWQSNYSKAKEYYLATFKFFKTYTNMLIRGKVLLGLGYVYHYEERYDFAEKVYKVAMKYITQERDFISYGRLMHNLGEVYLKQGKNELARKHFEKSLEGENIYKADKSRTVSSLCGIAYSYLHTDLTRAKTYSIYALNRAMEGLKSRFSRTEEEDLARIFLLLCHWMYNEQNFTECMIYLKQAETIIKKYSMKPEMAQLEEFKKNHHL